MNKKNHRGLTGAVIYLIIYFIITLYITIVQQYIISNIIIVAYCYIIAHLAARDISLDERILLQSCLSDFKLF